MNKDNVKNLKNILQGKDPEKKIQVGYKDVKKGPSRYGRKVGDVWEENGKKWKLTEAGIVSVNRMDEYRIPMFCPECGKIMKGKKDTKAYYSNNTCLNCMIDYHESLRKKGKLDQFAFRKRLLSAISWFDDQEKQFDEFKDRVKENPEFVFSDGRVEKWNNELDSDKLIEEYKDFLEDYRKKLNDSIKKYENKYGEKLDEWEEPE